MSRRLTAIVLTAALLAGAALPGCSKNSTEPAVTHNKSLMNRDGGGPPVAGKK
jgi:hypothetical protein